MDLLWRLEGPAQGERTGMMGIYSSFVLYREKRIEFKYNTTAHHPGPCQDWLEQDLGLPEYHRRALDSVMTPDHMCAFKSLDAARGWFYDAEDMPLLHKLGVKLVAINVRDVADIWHAEMQTIFRRRYKRKTVKVPTILRPKEMRDARVAKGYRRAYMDITHLHGTDDEVPFSMAKKNMAWEPEKVD